MLARLKEIALNVSMLTATVVLCVWIGRTDVYAAESALAPSLVVSHITECASNDPDATAECERYMRDRQEYNLRSNQPDLMPYSRGRLNTLEKKPWLKMHAGVRRHADGIKVVLPTVIGRTKDGKYNVYNLVGHLRDYLFTEEQHGQLYQWTDVDLYNHLPHLKMKDNDHVNYFCDQAVCYDRSMHLVAAAPVYKLRK